MILQLEYEGFFLQFSGLFMKYAFSCLLSLLPHGSNSCYEQLESSEKETILFKLNINGFFPIASQTQRHLTNKKYSLCAWSNCTQREFFATNISNTSIILCQQTVSSMEITIEQGLAPTMERRPRADTETRKWIKVSYRYRKLCLKNFFFLSSSWINVSSIP